MKYKLDLSQKMSMASPPITGAQVAGKTSVEFAAWMPSTWPAPEGMSPDDFVLTLKEIFEQSMLVEIRNVIDDIQKSNATLAFRGHVVAIALMCALDAISSYGYRSRHVGGFIEIHFPVDYRPYAGNIYNAYRLSLVHTWNLFGATLYANDEPIRQEGEVIAFGILNFFAALIAGTEDFLRQLSRNQHLFDNAMRRYVELRNSAKP